MVTPEHHVALVDRLVQRSEPVRPLWPVRARLGAFLVSWATVGMLLVWAWPRPDLSARLQEPPFLVGLATLAMASGLALLLSLRSAVPGRAPTRVEAGALIMLVTVAVLSLIEPTTGAEELAAGWACGLRTLALAVVPWIAVLIAIRRGAPVRLTSAAAYGGAAALLASTAVLRATCPESGTLHWIGWHLGTVAVALTASIPLVTAWLRTWRHDPVPN